MIRRRAARFLASLTLAALLGPGIGAPTSAQAQSQDNAERPLVAAASSLQFALPDLADAFAEATGAGVRLTFGASGNLARQIRQGAPFALYLAADAAYVRDLAARGFTRGAGTVYARGRLALIAPPGAPFDPADGLAGVKRALAAGKIDRFAIANPDHAPYGVRAKQALRHAELWERLRPHLIFGENVAQAARFASTGNAQGGLVAASLAQAPKVAARVRHALIPEGAHAPLRQRMVLLQGAGPWAEHFYDFLQTPAARAIWRAHGFAPPGGGDG